MKEYLRNKWSYYFGGLVILIIIGYVLEYCVINKILYLSLIDR